jgi:hypothetical protein
MPILNYTTAVPAARSIGEIQERLATHGADAITVRYVEREPVALVFTLDTAAGVFAYRLPANIDAVARLLARAPRATKTRAQAVRVAWRILKDWVEAQVAIIEAGLVSMDQVFLPYLETRPGGPSLYEAFQAHGRILLNM